MSGTFAGLVIRLIELINMVIPLIAGFAMVAFMYNTFQLVWETQSGHTHSERRTAILWSLVALFVLFSIWGILRLLLHTFLPDQLNPPGTDTYFDSQTNTYYYL